MLIYVGEIVTVEARGQAWRALRCEHCRQQFYYQVTFTAAGSANNPYFLDADSPRRAEKDAQNLLDHALRNEVFPVPCAYCNLYQKDMMSAVRAALFPRMRLAARLLLGLTPVALLLGCVILGLADGHAAPATVAVMVVLPMLCLSAGIWLLGARSRRQAAYDPNAEGYSWSRRRVATAFALKPEEFAQLRVEALASRPREQIVGRNCARCGQLISCSLDGEFCPVCGSPSHNQCIRPGEGTGCPTCGAMVDAS